MLASSVLLLFLTKAEFSRIRFFWGERGVLMLKVGGVH